MKQVIQHTKVDFFFMFIVKTVISWSLHTTVSGIT